MIVRQQEGVRIVTGKFKYGNSVPPASSAFWQVLLRIHSIDSCRPSAAPMAFSLDGVLLAVVTEQAVDILHVDQQKFILKLVIEA